MKVYVVFEGCTPGVYKTWMECEAQVSGYPGNVHKNFPSTEEGEHALAEYQAVMRKTTPKLKHFGGQEVGQRVEKKVVIGMNAKNLLLVVLVLLVLIQAYLLYRA
jgi:viroplasmin and RNaseH domain-containing protein